MTVHVIRRPTRRLQGDRGGRFLIPLVVILGLISIYPTLYSLYMSLFNWNWGERFNFVGVSK